MNKIKELKILKKLIKNFLKFWNNINKNNHPKMIMIRFLFNLLKQEKKKFMKVDSKINPKIKK